MPTMVDRPAIKQAIVEALQTEFDGTFSDPTVTAYYDWPGDEQADWSVVVGPPVGTVEPTTFGGASPTRQDEFTLDLQVRVHGEETAKAGDDAVQSILDSCVTALFVGPGRPGDALGAEPYPEGELTGPFSYADNGDTRSSGAVMTVTIRAHTTAA